MSRKTSFIFLICCLAIFVVMSLFGGSAKNDIDIGDESLTLSCKEFQTTVAYEDIRSVTVTELADYGTVVDGGLNRSCRWGTWENERFGRYTQYTAASTDCCVALELEDGSYVLLSFEGTESTKIMGDTLYEMLIDQGYNVKKLSE